MGQSRNFGMQSIIESLNELINTKFQERQAANITWRGVRLLEEFNWKFLALFDFYRLYGS